MTYKEALIEAHTKLGSDPRVCFVGYNVKYGLAGGMLGGVDKNQLIETPVAENLMASFAIGLSLKGRIPVVYYERFDFIMNSMDAIVNHLDKIRKISQGQFLPAALFRVVVGNRTKPLFTGATHIQDFSGAFRALVSFPVRQLHTAEDVTMYYGEAYVRATELAQSTLLVEYKDNY